MFAQEFNGKVLDMACRRPNDPNRVADILLYGHFKQAVLANMRGPGEPAFEQDFPPGTDQMGEIMRGP